MNEKINSLTRQSKDGSSIHIQTLGESYVVNYTEPKWNMTIPQDAFETLDEALGLIAELLDTHPDAGFDGSNCLDK